jgi:hypothetical protein
MEMFKNVIQGENAKTYAKGPLFNIYEHHEASTVDSIKGLA